VTYSLTRIDHVVGNVHKLLPTVRRKRRRRKRRREEE